MKVETEHLEGKSSIYAKTHMTLQKSWQCARLPQPLAYLTHAPCQFPSSFSCQFSQQRHVWSLRNNWTLKLSIYLRYVPATRERHMIVTLSEKTPDGRLASTKQSMCYVARLTTSNQGSRQSRENFCGQESTEYMLRR